MQSFAALCALVLAGYGFVTAGWRGALSGIVAAIGIGSSLAILGAEKGTAVSSDSNVKRAQQLGGVLGAIGVATGIWYGGWRDGWLWGVLGYVVGPLATIMISLVTRRSISGEPTTVAERVNSAAERILRRGSREPNSYLHDSRYVLYFACHSLTSMLVGNVSIDKIASVVGESPSAVEEILTFAGFDLRKLSSGSAEERMAYVADITPKLFADVESKYGQR